MPADLVLHRRLLLSQSQPSISEVASTGERGAMAHQQPYDPYYLHQAPAYGFNDRNGINTLFVSGLPDDVKTREIHNLFRRRSGFDSCQLKYTGRGSQTGSVQPLHFQEGSPM